MKHIYIYKPGLIVALIYYSFLSHAQNVPYVSIANWQGNKKAALCVTLDDGCVNQFEIGQAVLDAKGIKGTFYIITDLAVNCDGGQSTTYPNIYQGNGSPNYWGMLQTAINAGHEIGAHTVHHYYLGDYWDSTSHSRKEWRDTVGQEIKNSKATLEQNLYEPNGDPYNVLTFAYPYGSGQDNDSIVDSVQQYFIAARGAGTYNDTTWNWDTYAAPLGQNQGDGFFNYYYQVESYPATDTLSNKWFTQQLDSTIKYSGWFIPMYHNIGGNSLDSDGYSVTSQAFSDQIDSIVSRKDSFWIAPFRDIARYSEENISTTISVSNNPKLTNDSIITINISDTIKNPLFNVPLTVLVSNLSCSCSKDSIIIDSVVQASRRLKFESGKSTLQFNAVPDSGTITIYQGRKTAVTAVVTAAENYFELYQNIPNPSSSVTAISYNLKQAGTVKLELFDINGTAKTLVNEEQTTGKYSYSLNTESLQAGIYFYRLTSGNAFDVKKMVVLR